VGPVVQRAEDDAAWRETALVRGHVAMQSLDRTMPSAMRRF
jgi:hypothetical protein